MYAKVDGSNITKIKMKKYSELILIDCKGKPKILFGDIKSSLKLWIKLILKLILVLIDTPKYMMIFIIQQIRNLLILAQLF